MQFISLKIVKEYELNIFKFYSFCFKFLYPLMDMYAKEVIIMDKNAKKKILLGTTSKKISLVAHWNNDSGCRK